MFHLPPVIKNKVYFAFWEKGFSEKELDYLREKSINSNIQAQVEKYQQCFETEKVRRSKISWLHPTQNDLWIFEKLSYIVSNINAEYFRYDLTGFGEPLQLTNYHESDLGMYGWHIDLLSNGISRKLSVVLQLTDPNEYEGGDLQIMTGSAKPFTVKKERGLVVVFPSYLLHQVTPVTKGNRQSLVAWVSGPPFR